MNRGRQGNHTRSPRVGIPHAQGHRRPRQLAGAFVELRDNGGLDPSVLEGEGRVAHVGLEVVLEDRSPARILDLQAARGVVVVERHGHGGIGARKNRRSRHVGPRRQLRFAAIDPHHVEDQFLFLLAVLNGDGQISLAAAMISSWLVFGRPKAMLS